MIELLYQSPYFFAAIGLVVGTVLLHLRAQGAQAWARNPWMLLIVAGAGAATSYLVSQMEVGYGGRMVFVCASAAWAATWVLFGLLALWRNNWVIGRVLDPRFLHCVGAIALGAGLIWVLVSRASDYAPAVWAYVALPSLAGALYRFLLVVLFLREPVHDREALGARIDIGLQGPVAAGATLSPARPAGKTAASAAAESGVLFNPLSVRTGDGGASSSGSQGSA